ncbi:MAG: hypothetical protein GXO29_06690 [Thermotogae bacterium]|nr:hypothetical protein [Thermotogota bacterium]
MRCGIDEAGLGPLVGSLFVVGVKVEGDLSSVRESKEVFRRSLRTYAEGERVVLGLLKALGMYSPSVSETWRRIFGRSPAMLEGLRFPLFGGSPSPLPFRVLDVVAVEVEAFRLRSHRFVKDARAMVSIALGLNCPQVISGLAGGFKDYGRFLRGWDGERLEDGILYRRGKRRILFLRKADARFGEVALASLIAKYLREVHMLALNRLVGLEGDIPPASGYPSDPMTPVLIERLIAAGRTEFLRGSSPPNALGDQTVG